MLSPRRRHRELSRSSSDRYPAALSTSSPRDRFAASWYSVRARAPLNLPTERSVVQNFGSSAGKGFCASLACDCALGNGGDEFGVLSRARRGRNGSSVPSRELAVFRSPP